MGLQVCVQRVVLAVRRDWAHQTATAHVHRGTIVPLAPSRIVTSRVATAACTVPRARRGRWQWVEATTPVVALRLHSSLIRQCVLWVTSAMAATRYRIAAERRRTHHSIESFRDVTVTELMIVWIRCFFAVVTADCVSSRSVWQYSGTVAVDVQRHLC